MKDGQPWTSVKAPLTRFPSIPGEWSRRFSFLLPTLQSRLNAATILYVLFMGLAGFLGLIKTMVYGAFLTPEEMGYLSIALTVASYGVFLQMGTMNGLNRELPVALGAGRAADTGRLVGDTTTAVLLFQSIGLALFLIALTQVSFADRALNMAFIFGGFLAFSASFGQMVILRLRAERRVLGFSMLQLLNAAGVLVFGVFGILYFSCWGAILVQIGIHILGFTVVTCWFLSSADYRHFHWRNVRYLMGIGLPLLGSGVLLNLQLSMDRLFLIKSVSPREIGIYQMGTFPLSIGIVLGSLVSQYVGPALLYRFGQGQPLSYIFRRASQISFGVIAAMLVAFPLVIFLASWAIDLWLPKYSDCLPIVSIFYLGAVFTSANTDVVINAANRQLWSFYSFGLVLICCFVGFLLVARWEKPIEWYAYINCAGQVMNFLLTFGLSYYLAHNQKNLLKD